MSRIPVRFRLVASALAVFAAAYAQAADPTPWEAHKWDLPLNLGAGGWRGLKPVFSEDKQKHQIDPGAFVDSAIFDGKGGIQWTVDGALLKDCQFSGDLGFHFTAKDSAFDGCKLHKTGGWFVSWGGTKWRLTNCLFTRSFMPKDIGLHDYSVRAENCTFVGVEMPRMTHKNDPSTYVGKDDVKFENCLFVGCDITESVLAASVNSSFEGCRFRLDLEKDPNKPDQWENAKAAVSVTAHIIGEKPRAPYIHGQLSVNFVKAEPGETPGCTIPFTRAGARVILPAWAAQISTFKKIGSLDRAASEIPTAPETTATAAAAVATPPPPVARSISGSNAFLNLPPPKARAAATPPSPPPAPPKPAPVATATAPAATPPPVPNDVPIRKVDDFAGHLPKGLNVVVNGKATADGLEQAAQAFEKWGLGRVAIFRVAVEQNRTIADEGYEFQVSTVPLPLRLPGTFIGARVEAKFRSTQNPQRAKVAKGATIVVHGTISKVTVGGTARQPELIVTLEEASVE